MKDVRTVGRAIAAENRADHSFAISTLPMVSAEARRAASQGQAPLWFASGPGPDKQWSKRIAGSQGGVVEIK